MFIKLSILSVITACIVAQSQTSPTATSCRDRSDLVGKCFSVHGRLSVYNGTPSVRLWPIGSKRLLGVFDPKDPSGELGESVFPGSIKKQLNWDKFVDGDFLVCPLTRSTPGRMQTICIQSGKNLTVRQRKD